VAEYEEATDDAVATETRRGRFQAEIAVAGQRLIADEPVSVGGMGTGPTPYQLLASALAACTTMTIRPYADQKGWPVNLVRTAAGHKREAHRSPVDLFTRRISIEGDLSEEQISRLLEIADRCPVHRTLTSGARVETSIGQPPAPSGPAGQHIEAMDAAEVA
jgi:putative redox protein